MSEEKERAPKSGAMIDACGIMDAALANQRVLDEIWRKDRENRKKKE